MWWQRRQSRGEPTHDADLTPDADLSETVFSGVSREPGRGIARSDLSISGRKPGMMGAIVGNGLYEFWTDEGLHVYLHDLDFEGFDVRVSEVPSLVATFRYEDGVVPDGYAGPVVQFTFIEVRLLHCEQDLLDESSKPYRRQVYSFDWESGNEFCLSTLDTELRFTATACNVAVLQSTG